MKMNYLLKSSNQADRQRQARRRVLITGLVLLLIILLMVIGPSRRLLFSLAEPLWRLEAGIKNSPFLEYFKTKQTLIDEKRLLEQKLFLSGNLMALNETLDKENATLKDLLGRHEIKQDSVLATVLVKPPQLPYDLLLIDIGADQGVKVGDRVIANANVYVGEVSEVYPHTAKVILYSTPGRRLSVTLGANSVSLEAVGMGAGNFSITMPREVEVKESDVIVVPSITTNIFGIVEKVSFEEKDSFQTVLFKSPVNIAELNFVEVII